MLTTRPGDRPTKKRSVVVAGIAHVGGGRDISLGHSGNVDDHRDVSFKFSVLPSFILLNRYYTTQRDSWGNLLLITTIFLSGSGDFLANSYLQPNVDYCSACSGTGRLLCCDGCTRAFHFTCLDPPISENSEGDFYCYVCAWRRHPPPRHPRGVFGPLHDLLEKKNPTAFHLPYEIREYYEGVRTGTDGEYEETVKQKPSRYVDMNFGNHQADSYTDHVRATLNPQSTRTPSETRKTINLFSAIAVENLLPTVVKSSHVTSAVFTGTWTA